MAQSLFQTVDVTDQLPRQLVSESICCIRVSGGYVYVLSRNTGETFSLSIYEAQGRVTVAELTNQKLTPVGTLEIASRLPCASLYPSETGLYAFLSLYSPKGGDAENYGLSLVPKFNKVVKRRVTALRERAVSCAFQPTISPLYKGVAPQADALDTRSAEFLVLTASGSFWACQIEKKEVQARQLSTAAESFKPEVSLAQKCRDYYTSGALYILNVSLETVAAQAEINIPHVFGGEGPGAARSGMLSVLQKVSGLISRLNLLLVIAVVGVEVYVYLEKAGSLFSLKLDEQSIIKHWSFQEYLVPESGRAARSAKAERSLLPLGFSSFLSLSRKTGITVEICFQPAAARPISVLAVQLSCGKILETVLKSHCVIELNKKPELICRNDEPEIFASLLQQMAPDSFRRVRWNRRFIHGVNAIRRTIGGTQSPEIPGLMGLSGAVDVASFTEGLAAGAGPFSPSSPTGTAASQVFLGAVPFGWHTLYLTNTRVYVCNHISGKVVESLSFPQGPVATSLLQALGVLSTPRSADGSAGAEGGSASSPISTPVPGRDVVLAFRSFLSSQLLISPISSFNGFTPRRTDYSGFTAIGITTWLPMLPGTILWTAAGDSGRADQVAFALESANEARDLWKVYFGEKQYELALANCRNEADLKRIREEYADVCLRDGRDILAARLYAQTDISLFRVCQDLLTEERHQTALDYLLQKIPTIPRLPKPVKPQGDDVTIQDLEAYDRAQKAYQEAKNSRTLAAHLYVEILTLEISKARSKIRELDEKTALAKLRPRLGPEGGDENAEAAGSAEAAEGSYVIDAEEYFLERKERAGYDLTVDEEEELAARLASPAKGAEREPEEPSVMALQDDIEMYRGQIVAAFSNPEISPYLSAPVIKHTLGLHDLGREYLTYCKMKGDLRSAIDYQIQHKRFTDALDTLKSFSDDAVYYYTGTFLRHIPQSFCKLVQARLEKKNSTFCIQKIIQTVWEVADSSPACRKHICNFLRWLLIDFCCTDGGASLFAIEFLAYYDDDGEDFLVEILRDPRVQERASSSQADPAVGETGGAVEASATREAPQSLRGQPGEAAVFDLQSVLAICRRLNLRHAEAECQKLCGNSENAVLLNLGLLETVVVSELSVDELPTEAELGLEGDGAGLQIDGDDVAELVLPAEHAKASAMIRDLIDSAANSIRKTRLTTLYMKWLCNLALENDAGIPDREFSDLQRRFRAACIWEAASFLQKVGCQSFSVFMAALPADTEVKMTQMAVRRAFRNIVDSNGYTQERLNSVCAMLEGRRQETASGRGFSLEFDTRALASLAPRDDSTKEGGGYRAAPACCCCGQSLSSPIGQVGAVAQYSSDAGPRRFVPDEIFPDALLAYPCGHVSHFSCMMEKLRRSSSASRAILRMISAYKDDKRKYLRACEKDSSGNIFSLFLFKQANADLETQRAAVMSLGEGLLDRLSHECHICSLQTVEEVFDRLPPSALKMP